MNWQALKTELALPAYAGMTDAQKAAAVNAKTVNVNKTTMTASEVLNAVVASEWTALSAANKQLVWDVVHLGTLNPFGVEATLMVNAFGAGSQTIAALAAKRVTTVRWLEAVAGMDAGFMLDAGDIETARNK
jgi:hypothetical protein